MRSAARALTDSTGAEYAVRWALVGKLGRIRSRQRGEGGVREFYLDFRPYGRVWSHRGIRLLDEETARRLMEQIRGKVAEGMPLAEVLARYQPPSAKANRVPMWLARWLEIRRRECEARSLSPGYVRELTQLCAPGGHFSFLEKTSIHEISVGVLEDWSLWLADRGLSPKSRRNVMGYFRAFLAWLHRRGELREVPVFPLPKADEHEPRLLAISDQDRVLAAISEEERGIFFAMARLGLRPGEARALEVGDYHDGWVSVDKAVKGKTVSAPVRGTKTGKSKRLPVDSELAEWTLRHGDPQDRFRRAPLFVNPRTGGIWAHKALARVWARAVEAAGLPHISLYEGTKHTFATDAIRRGVPERHLQRFLGHASIQSTRRYARLADNALIEVLRVPARLTHTDDAPSDTPTWRQPDDKVQRNKSETRRGVSGGPSRVRTWDRPVMSRLL